MTPTQEEELKAKIKSIVSTLSCANSDCGMRESNCVDSIFNFFLSEIKERQTKIDELLEIKNPEHKKESDIVLGWLEKRIELNDYQRQYFHFAFSDILQDKESLQEQLKAADELIESIPFHTATRRGLEAYKKYEQLKNSK